MLSRKSPETTVPRWKEIMLKGTAILAVGGTALTLSGCGEKANATSPTPSEMSTSQQETTGGSTASNTSGSETSNDPKALSPKEILAKLDVHSRDMVDFYPIPLDNSSPEALLLSFTYLENGLANSTNQDTIDAIIKSITGHDPKTATDQNTIVYRDYAKRIADKRLGFPTYKIESEYSFESSSVDSDGNIIIETSKDLEDSQDSVFPEKDIKLIFAETDGETHLSPESKIVWSGSAD